MHFKNVDLAELRQLLNFLLLHVYTMNEPVERKEEEIRFIVSILPPVAAG